MPSNIRVGQVSSVNPKNNTVRVAFDDMTGPTGKEFVSAEMQVMQRNTVGARNLSLPEVGEHVLCTHLQNGEQEGFVLGSYYTASNMPDNATGVYRTEYSDGTVIEYNVGTGTASIKTSGYAIVEAKEAVVTAETIRITGNVQITGDVTVNGSIRATVDILAAGKSDNHHTHA